MTEDDLREIEARRILAEIAREEAELRKLELETRLLDSEVNQSFFFSRKFLRPLAAGVSLALIFAAYIQYVFLPSQLSLNQKIETAEFTLQQNTVRHNAQVAKLELITTRIEEDARRAKSELELAEVRLKEAGEQNGVLLGRINELTLNSGSDQALEKLGTEVKASGEKIQGQLASIQEQKAQLEVLEDTAKEKRQVAQDSEGWIYIGYFPGDRWQFRTIDIEQGEPISGTEYTVKESVNLRTKSPVFTLLGYRYGDSLGFLVPGQNVVIEEITEVGLSKIWARVTVAD